MFLLHTYLFYVFIVLFVNCTLRKYIGQKGNMVTIYVKEWQIFKLCLWKRKFKQQPIHS